MSVSDKRKEYIYQYQREKLKRIPLDVPKDDYERIKAHSDAQGESVNGFIKRAISEAMEREKGDEAPNADTLAAIAEGDEMLVTGKGQHFKGRAEDFLAILAAENSDE